MKKKNIINKHKWVTQLIVIFVILAFIPIIVLIVLYISTDNPQLNGLLLSLSYVGQFLSGTTAIFISVSAMLAIVLAYLSQREQIDIQKDEIKEGKKNEEIRNFENNFYQLLNIHRNNLNSINYPCNDGKRSSTLEKDEISVNGIIALKKIFDNQLLETIKVFTKAIDSSNKDNNVQIIFNKAYKIFIDKNNNVLSHYFQTFRLILELIHKSMDIFEDKRKSMDMFEDKRKINFYLNIFRCQLSSLELSFIFFNGLSDVAGYGLSELSHNKLIEYFHLFEYIDLADFIQYNDNDVKKAVLALIDLYKDSAYGNRKEEIVKSFSLS